MSFFSVGLIFFKKERYPMLYDSFQIFGKLECPMMRFSTFWPSITVHCHKNISPS